MSVNERIKLNRYLNGFFIVQKSFLLFLVICKLDNQWQHMEMFGAYHAKF